MNTLARRTTRFALAAAAVGTAFTLGTGTAAADDWPVQSPSSPIYVHDATGFLTPSDLDYWNPFVNQPRLTSPYGNSTRVVCAGFHGVDTDCWQADADGNPHKLKRLQANFPNITGSSAPGGGVSHWVYPGFIPGIS
ncbi:hypothetical protein [Nocardia sp. CDC160]|uniref:hypothetical protein n=1 Tax=Nocardia sp. CDC160 TaxID=3112166 RepID=UPI002DBB9F9F|nr:hypothetical protein [Nocardia sp. CDC160]MEC3917174.1 hypothetical protein [Nocardia sp. CDC160]